MTWLQTLSGRAFDLLNPTPNMVDFEQDIPYALAALARFNGHVAHGVYSVAQHCVLGADWLERETGNPTLAAAFLLHDAHEAYIGDICTPVAEALEAHDRHSEWPLFLLKRRADVAIYKAAGGMTAHEANAAPVLKRMDLRMLAIERRDLLGPAPRPWTVKALPASDMAHPRIKPWSRERAAGEYLDRLNKWLPNRQRAA